MPTSWGMTLALSAVIMLVLYRRGRRLVARQKFSAPRLCFRLALLATITTMLFIVLSLARGLVPLAGLAAGATIAGFSVVLTRFESIEGELHFTPNRYLGLAVLSLFIGRMLYRLVTVVAVRQTVGDDADPVSLASLETLRSSPTMSGVLFMLLGYYLTYSAGVLVRGWRMPPAPRPTLST